MHTFLVKSLASHPAILISISYTNFVYRFLTQSLKPISYTDYSRRFLCQFLTLIYYSFSYTDLLNQFHTPIYYRYFLQRFLTVSVQSRPSFLSCCNPPPPWGGRSPRRSCPGSWGQGKQKHVCVYWASKNMLALLCQQMRWFHAQMGAVVPRYFFVP